MDDSSILDARVFEIILHNNFRKFKSVGEWFRLDIDDVLAVWVLLAEAAIDDIRKYRGK